MQQKEIWLINLDPTVGAEISKTRPAVILNSDNVGVLPLRLIAPITDYKSHYKDVPWMLVLQPNAQNGLRKKSMVDLFQVRSVSIQRLHRKMGIITNQQFVRVQEALQHVFGID
ncbi:MAG: type II toxin-antitoxin system PemK/MazF family toxin [Candidatus Sericytochromatia bacterium]|nr:type II toxin-antitoxin system PemK/MazF family toxin [Candidatus Sericytochromatia bacterium]